MPPVLSDWVTICTMSPPSAFILLWNSMQPTPSPRSISDAPAFFLTTPPDFFLAISTDHTPAVAGAGLYPPPATSKKARPELAEASSTYQDFLPAASSL